MLTSCASARNAYQVDMENKKKERGDAASGVKRKSIMDELDSTKAKKKKLTEEINYLTNKTDKLCEDAEKHGNLRFVVESNALRSRVSKKAQESRDLVCQITKILAEL